MDRRKCVCRRAAYGVAGRKAKPLRDGCDRLDLEAVLVAHLVVNMVDVSATAKEFTGRPTYDSNEGYGKMIASDIGGLSSRCRGCIQS